MEICGRIDVDAINCPHQGIEFVGKGYKYMDAIMRPYGFRIMIGTGRKYASPHLLTSSPPQPPQPPHHPQHPINKR